MDLKTLIEGNREWQKHKDSTFFKSLAAGQKPEILWIGCSDSRIDPQEITGQTVGSIFVHRNIANMVIPSDASIKGVVNYAVTELKVKHIVICGHYKCGGVQGAMTGVGEALADVGSWLAPLKAIHDEHQSTLKDLTEEAKWEKLVELNVEKQVHNMASLKAVQQFWEEGGELSIHGVVCQLCERAADLVDLDITLNGDRASEISSSI